MGCEGCFWMTNEEIALKGIGQTEILMENAEDAGQKAFARAMNEAFTNLYRMVKENDFIRPT